MKKYLALILIVSCCSTGFKKANLNNPDIKDYMFSYLTGELGALPVWCDIINVEFDGNSVFVSGKAYDEETLETFPNTIWVGKYIEKTDWAGDIDSELTKEEKLMDTEDNGVFNVKIKLKKDDCLIIGTLGYYPVVIRIYDYVNDFY